MAMQPSILLLLVTSIIASSKAFEWNDHPGANDVIYACAGQDVSLVWLYDLQENEEVTDINWLFAGDFSHDIIATFTNEYSKFLPTAKYAPRLRHDRQASVTLRDVTIQDMGSYSVQVKGHDSRERGFTYERSVLLQVSDGPMLQGGSLQIRQDPVAYWDTEKKEWFIRLLCGTFTFRGTPSVAVTWTTPSGEENASMRYEDGTFSLSLYTPVAGGSYSCRLDPSVLPDICVKPHTDSDGQATPMSTTLEVSDLHTRLSLLEAELDSMKKRQDEITVANISEQVKSELKPWTQGQLASMNDSIHTVATDLQGVKKTIAFYVTLKPPTHHFTTNVEVIFKNVVINLGDGYDVTTGIFTAPIGGVYFFTGVASVARGDNRADLIMVLDGEAVAQSYAFQEKDHYQSGSCHAVLTLKRGQRVWIKSNGNTALWGGSRSSFSGFLVSFV